MGALRDHQWRRRFSSSLESLLDGMGNLVAPPDALSHGQMRLITGVFLSEADITPLAAGAPAETVLTDHLSSHFPVKGVEPGGLGAAALAFEAEPPAWGPSAARPLLGLNWPIIKAQHRGR